MTSTLTIGERVAWYRRRRGMSQEVLAGLVGRTADWLSKVENDRIELDRLSVIKSLSDALDITLGDLIAEPALMEWVPDSGTHTVPALSAALMDYRLITPVSASSAAVAEPPKLTTLEREVDEMWQAYQAARFGYVTTLLPEALARAHLATELLDGDDRVAAQRLLAYTYQLAAAQMTKIGEVELAWIAADRGLAAARATGDRVVMGSLFRSVAHALLAAGRFREAVQLTEDTAGYLDPHLGTASPELLAVHGTLFLTGSMAASRANDAATTRTFLAAAGESAQRLGVDGNLVWTAFGPTNVAIHRVATAAELGDVQVAVDLGPRVDTSSLPMERRVRHALELARAYSAWNRTDEAMATLMAAERIGPEQVRYHFLSRQLVLTWIKRHRGKPSTTLVDLARRLKVLS
jgi:transcriptional regulator with XRE-family HTH domain